jgi:hypothetical protein
VFLKEGASEFEVISSISALVSAINLLIAGRKCSFFILKNGAVLYETKRGFFIDFLKCKILNAKL